MTDNRAVSDIGEGGGYGVVYVPAYRLRYDNQYMASVENEVTAAKIFQLRGNVYAAGVERKQKNLLFSEEPTIEVLGPDGEVDEDLQTKLTMMMESPDVDYKIRMAQGWADVFWYGMSVYNWVWGFDNNEYTLTSLVKLPAYSFDTPKTGVVLSHSPILQGVTLSADAQGRPLLGAEIEFWQRQSVLMSAPVKLDSKNLCWVKDPSCDGLAGDAIIRPLIPVFEMLSFTWNSEMQFINRVGAPPLFIKITSPQAANQANGMVSDVDYANNLLSNWGKDSQYQIRSNFELIGYPGSAATDRNPALEVADALHWLIIDYMTPSSFVDPKSGQILGGSRSGAIELFQDYIQGVHRWLESEFNRILARYLEVNGYGGWRARIMYPMRGEDKSDVMLQQAMAGARLGVLDFNEVRERLEAVDVDDDTRDDITRFWQSNKPQPPGSELESPSPEKKELNKPN